MIKSRVLAFERDVSRFFMKQENMTNIRVQKVSQSCFSLHEFLLTCKESKQKSLIYISKGNEIVYRKGNKGHVYGFAKLMQK